MERTAPLSNLELLVRSGCLAFPKGMAGMDSWNQHVEQISFRQCIIFCKSGQLKGWQPHFQPTVAKSSISTIARWFAAVTIAQLRAQSLHCKKSWRPQLRDQTLCFCAWDWHFSVAETKGWAWCKHNAELVEHTVALRNLLLVETGCLEFQNGTAGMDILNKHVEQFFFRQCVTFCEHGQLKGWQPHFQPTIAKSSISTTVHWFKAVW